MILDFVSADTQAGLPQAVRAALGLGEGDRLVYVQDAELGVRLARAEVALADPFLNPLAAFSEWADPLDAEAFRDL